MRNMDIKYQITIKGVDPMMDKKIKEEIAKLLKENGYTNSNVEYDPNNMTMMTDFYEMTMSQVNYKYKEYEQIDYYDGFFRKEPLNAGYGIVSGLNKLIKYIQEFHFTDEDIDFLRTKGELDEEFLNYLRHLQFTGDIWAMPDGTPIFRTEPFITVKAPRIQCKLIETAILAIYNSNIAYTTAAKKIINASEDIPVMEFGSRRAYGTNAAVDASIDSLIAGCIGTSNVKVAQMTNTKPLGTMAHCQVMEAKNEYEAFDKYAKTFPNNAMMLVDTYNTLNGTKNAVDVCLNNNIDLAGIRIDSGDLAYLSKEAKKIMESAYPNAKICLSNGLTAETIESLKNQGAVMDSLGVGDNISSPLKRVGAVYKLCATEEKGEVVPKIKVSGDAIKTTNPGYKKIYRFYDKETGYAKGDVIALASEEIDKKSYTLVCDNEPWKKTKLENYEVRELQVPIFINGKLVYNEPTLEEKIAYCKKEVATLYPKVKRTLNPHKYYVDLSDELRKLKQELIEKVQVENENKVYQKKLVR